jgi:hypothetical protein
MSSWYDVCAHACICRRLLVWTSRMALNFPNFSRSYDAAANRIRFWGHDGAVEIPFFLEWARC